MGTISFVSIGKKFDRSFVVVLMVGFKVFFEGSSFFTLVLREFYVLRRVFWVLFIWVVGSWKIGRKRNLVFVFGRRVVLVSSFLCR